VAFAHRFTKLGNVWLQRTAALTVHDPRILHRISRKNGVQVAP